MRDEAEYARLVAEFQAAHGEVKITRRKKRVCKPPKPSAEDVFAAAWAATGGPAPVRQHRFHAERKWTLDFAWVDAKLALELEGWAAGGFGGGRHHLPQGIIDDATKFNTALLQGWRVLRVPSRGGRDVKLWVELVQRALAAPVRGEQ